MNIAIITGAACGIGREFACQIDKRLAPDEIWLVDKQREKMEILASQLHSKAKIIAADLSRSEDIDQLSNLLEQEKPSVKLLVNAAGVGKFGSFASQTLFDSESMIDINIKALTAVTKICLPYLPPLGGIVNMSSVSAFLPLPFLNVYAATKAYVLRFSQALSYELRDKKIRVTAVCPYWVATEFIPSAQLSPRGESVDNFMFISYPYPVVRRALIDNGAGRIMSLCGCIARSLKCLSAHTPVKLQMGIWNCLRSLSSSRCNLLCPGQWQLQGFADRFHR